MEPFPEIKEFKCFQGCGACCKDPAMPISVTLKDLRRISKFLHIRISELYENYCTVSEVTDLEDSTLHCATISFTIPCKFLKNDKCSIYNIRPIGCVIFPAFLGESDYLIRRGKGYKCIDEGYFDFPQNKLKRLEVAKLKAIKETSETANYFNFASFDLRFREEELATIYAQISKKLGIDVKPFIVKGERRSIGAFSFRQYQEIESLYHELVASKIRGNVGSAFLNKCKELDGK